MSATPTDALKAATDRLADARIAFDNAEKKYRQASSSKTYALNRLNEAQKVFDAAVEELRSKAPSDSDWKLKLQRRDMVRAIGRNGGE